MALVIRNLVTMVTIPWQVNGPFFTKYGYATPDAVATVIAAGYFNAARDAGRLQVNDIIDAQCVMGGVADFVRLIVTAVPATGNVTVAVNTGASGL